MGYNWSIWYIPIEYEEFKTRYGMFHIPHTTAITNLKEKPSKEDLEKWSETLDYIDIVSDLEKMEQSYDNDPLFGCGWSCKSIPKLDIDHQLHLTYKYYSHNEYNIEHTRNYVNIPSRIYNWKRVIADTRDDNPENWKIIE